MRPLHEKQRRIVEAARVVFRRDGKSPKTIKAYLGWIRRFFAAYPDRAPSELGVAEITAFLNRLADGLDVSASTQNQALSALKALYERVYQEDFPTLDHLKRPRRAKTLPYAPPREHIAALREELQGVYLVVFFILYGSGLRLNECMTLRVQDVDLNAGLIHIRSGKGRKDRTTMIAKRATDLLSTHLPAVYAQHQRDLAGDAGYVELPHALRRKYPNAPREWRYQWVFPATRTYTCETTGERRRHHLHESAVQRELKAASARANLPRPITPHSLRHAFSLHFLDDDPDLRELNKLLGHSDIRTTMIYAQLRRALRRRKSPADDL